MEDCTVVDQYKGELENVVEEIIQDLCTSDDFSIKSHKRSIELLSTSQLVATHLIALELNFFYDQVSKTTTELDSEVWTYQFNTYHRMALKGKCSTISNIIAMELRSNGIDCKVTLPDISEYEEAALPEDADYSIHRYIKILTIKGIDVSKLDIIIDPTISQFIEGYYNIFIGTRGSLREIYLEALGSGRIVNTRYPEHLFIRAWGNRSMA